MNIAQVFSDEKHPSGVKEKQREYKYRFTVDTAKNGDKR